MLQFSQLPAKLILTLVAAQQKGWKIMRFPAHNGHVHENKNNGKKELELTNVYSNKLIFNTVHFLKKVLLGNELVTCTIMRKSITQATAINLFLQKLMSL